MAHSEKDDYPRIRVFGTIGWVSACVFSLVAAAFGFKGFDSSRWIFAAGAATTAFAGLFTLVLPRTAPRAKGEKVSVCDALGLRALVLFKDARFRSFAILLLLAMIPFQWYNTYCAAYLKDSGFQYLTLTMNLGQAGEIGFMLLVPLIFRKVGYRGGIVLALLALVFRNASFALSSAFGLSAFNFSAILIHGLIFGLLVVGSQMFVDEVAPPELRNQAQGLVNLLTAGVGVFASNVIFDTILGTATPTPWTLAYVVSGSVALVAAAFGLATGMRRAAKV